MPIFDRFPGHDLREAALQAGRLQVYSTAVLLPFPANLSRAREVRLSQRIDLDVAKPWHPGRYVLIGRSARRTQIRRASEGTTVEREIDGSAEVDVVERRPAGVEHQVSTC